MENAISNHKVERLKQVRSEQNMSQKQFGDVLGVSRDVVANVESCRVEPSEIYCRHLCNVFSVRSEWLETGAGDIYNIKDKNLEEALRLFEGLNPELQEYAIKQIRLLLELQEKQGT